MKRKDSQALNWSRSSRGHRKDEFSQNACKNINPIHIFDAIEKFELNKKKLQPLKL